MALLCYIVELTLYHVLGEGADGEGSYESAWEEALPDAECMLPSQQSKRSDAKKCAVDLDKRDLKF
jgi:hypothetical protein